MSLTPYPRSAALLACVTAICLACAGSRDRAPADLILLNGKVLTLDPALPRARAVALRRGLIAAVGEDDAVLPLAGPGTRRIDLRGRLVLPGLIDSHGHLRSLGEQLAGLDLRGVTRVEEVVRRVKARAAESPTGEWITGIGWDQNLWPGGRYPDHRPLSEAVPDRPVWLSRIDWYAGWANRKAMQVAGVTRATPDPPGGRILHDARGEPTGLFVGEAMGIVSKAQAPPSRETIKSWIRLALARCAEVGLTEVHDASVTREEAAAFRELADEGNLPLRVYLMWKGFGGEPVESMLAEPILVGYKDRLTLRALKLLIDGTMGSRGALLFEDYSDDPGNRGFFVTPAEEIRRLAELGLRRGYQVCTHAIGDRGIRLTLDAYEQALAAFPAPDPRLRIEHLQCVTQQDVPRLKLLGVIASMQPSHATSEIGWSESRVGAERARGLYALRWVLDAGVTLAAGSDFPVDPESPLVGIHSAVTRQNERGQPAAGWHPEQRLSLEDALRAYTAGAAYAAFEENYKGRIASGMWADLTVVSKDLTSIPPSEIPGAGISLTVVGGTIVYQDPRDGGPPP